MPKYVTPAPDGDFFSCATCGTLAEQHDLLWSPDRDKNDPLALRSCGACEAPHFFVHGRLVYPTAGGILPVDGMPEAASVVFEEARSISGASPRAAAALLRLALELLINEVVPGKRHLNDKIASLVADHGLHPTIQKSLDVVRVIGNDQVHPGVIDLRDDPNTVTQLFRLLNLITEQLIVLPQQIDAMYADLPENKRKDIERRDANRKQSIDQVTGS